MKLNKEYFQSPYYFFLKEDKDGGTLYYSMSQTIVESRTKKEKIKVDKSDLEVAKKVISKILKDKSVKNLSQLKKIIGLTLGQKSEKEDGEISRKGEIGELCIRGSGLAFGYYNDPEKTKQAFVQNPFVQALEQCQPLVLGQARQQADALSE